MVNEKFLSLIYPVMGNMRLCLNIYSHGTCTADFGLQFTQA